MIALRNQLQVHSPPMKPKLIPVMVRIRPSAKELLIKAATDQRRSQASIVESLIVSGLSPQYSSTVQRLESMLKKDL
jgi:hypothetical protein